MNPDSQVLIHHCRVLDSSGGHLPVQHSWERLLVGSQWGIWSLTAPVIPTDGLGKRHDPFPASGLTVAFTAGSVQPVRDHTFVATDRLE